MDVTYFFDPACPWTWRTSRWLVDVAAARRLGMEWRAFSLLRLNGNETPEEARARLEASARALRVVEALRAAGRQVDAGRFYTEIGLRTHDRGVDLTDEIGREAASAAGVGEAIGALGDATWDRAVHESHDWAYASAGPDIGSPVLALAGAERAIHGPILAALPNRDGSMVLWDALVPLLRMPWLYELKRGRVSR